MWIWLEEDGHCVSLEDRQGTLYTNNEDKREINKPKHMTCLCVKEMVFLEMENLILLLLTP